MSNKIKGSPNARPAHRVRDALTFGLIGLTAAGVYDHLKPKSPPYIQGKEYIMKAGDNPWNIVQRAYPNTDPRVRSDKMTHSLPEGVTVDTLEAGDRVILTASSKLGEPIKVSSKVKGSLPGVILFSGNLESKGQGKMIEIPENGHLVVEPNDSRAPFPTK